MISNYEEKPLSEPKLITQRQLDFMKGRFERDVIDPLFLGCTGDDSRDVQVEIDTAEAAFNRQIAGRFKLSNELELQIN